MRSKLFVPCARPEFFAKAIAGEADAISFDLEDSVPGDGKTAAREWLSEFLGSDAARRAAARQRLIVRVNAPGTPHFVDDIAAIAGSCVHLINLPKADSADDVRAAIEAVPTELPDLLVTIETPRALARAAAIGSAHPRVAGLQIGLNDLFEPLRIDRGDARHVHAALWTLRMASAEAGCFAYDGAFADLDDPDGFRREAELARGLGYLGKSCIHPSQVAIANAVFDRTSAELTAARRILSAARDAEALGRGAFRLDGRMIDQPAIAHARAVLAGGPSPR